MMKPPITPLQIRSLKARAKQRGMTVRELVAEWIGYGLQVDTKYNARPISFRNDT